MLENKYSVITKAGLLVFFLVMCFIPIQKSASTYYWGYDNDNFRDMSNVNNLVSGNLTEDPTYLDECRWYNPMLHWIEAIIVKTTGIPVNLVISQGGPYLNILSPICFFLMVLVLFNFKVAICATAGFLFFTANDIPGYFSATYTPWLYPVTFVQFLFYLGVIAMYYAFLKLELKWFALLGIVTGLAFLGHTGPTVILIMQIGVLTSVLVYKIIKRTSEQTIYNVLKFAIVAAVCFIIISLPFTYIVIGKYHLKLINEATYEYAEPIFQLRNLPELFKINLSVSFIVSVFGLYAFVKSKIPVTIKHILYSWLVISILMYIYVTMAKFIRFHGGPSLPGIVPSFHFFFYFKAVQSVFFGFGFVELMLRIFNFINTRYANHRFSLRQINRGIVLLIAALVIINYPGYLKRGDFYCVPEMANDENYWDQVEVYKWLTTQTGINDVVLCEERQITFPLLPSGRKMVVCSIDHTNPYVEYFDRKEDRDLMLDILKGSAPGNKALFEEYKVKYMMTNNSISYPNLDKFFPVRVFTSKNFSVYETL